MMKEQREKIDLLLEKNAAEQLANVDWEELNAAISSRLDKAQQSKTAAIRFPTVFKIATGVAAAAVILIAVILRTDKPSDMQLPDGTSAVVKFVETEGSALVEITHAPVKSQVFVDVGANLKKLAKCNVEIIDVSGDRQEDGSRAAWIIISRPEPVYADNGTSRDVMDFLYLF